MKETQIALKVAEGHSVLTSHRTEQLFIELDLISVFFFGQYSIFLFSLHRELQICHICVYIPPNQT
jgi:hypothetical protein